MNKKNLNAILKYRNSELIRTFRHHYGFDSRTANLVFKDLLMYLWLCSRGRYLRDTGKKNVPFLALFNSMSVVDEMWHLFILRTVEYEKFCMKYFGHFVHHHPETIRNNLPKNRKSLRIEKANGEKKLDEIVSVIDFVQDELGYAVAKRWYLTYPKYYSQKEIYRRLYARSKINVHEARRATPRLCVLIALARASPDCKDDGGSNKQ